MYYILFTQEEYSVKISDVLPVGLFIFLDIITPTQVTTFVISQFH
jgi:hypothetical protein